MSCLGLRAGKDKKFRFTRGTLSSSWTTRNVFLRRAQLTFVASATVRSQGHRGCSRRWDQAEDAAPNLDPLLGLHSLQQICPRSGTQLSHAPKITRHHFLFFVFFLFFVALLLTCASSEKQSPDDEDEVPNLKHCKRLTDILLQEESHFKHTGCRSWWCRNKPKRQRRAGISLSRNNNWNRTQFFLVLVATSVRGTMSDNQQPYSSLPPPFSLLLLSLSPSRTRTRTQEIPTRITPPGTHTHTRRREQRGRTEVDAVTK